MYEQYVMIEKRGKGERKMKNTNNELNSRQWKLYEYLKSKKGLPVTQINICRVLSGDYEEYRVDRNTPFHDSSARLTLTNDIRALNDSDIIQKVIISSKNGIFISKEEDYKAFLEKEQISILKRIIRFNKKKKKFGLHNQCKFTFGKGFEREHVEAFIE